MTVLQNIPVLNTCWGLQLHRCAFHCLKVIGFCKDDEVITSANSIVVTSEAITKTGAMATLLSAYD